MKEQFKYPNEPDTLIPILIASMMPVIIFDYALIWWVILT